MAVNRVQRDGPLLVIGAGLGRTGTKSLKAALEHLYDQPCYHMYQIVDCHKEHIHLWTNIFEKLKVNPETKLDPEVLTSIFKGYRTVTDHPACAIYPQLMRVYPEAKVILTVRNENAWLFRIREMEIPKHLLGKNLFRLVEHFTVGSGFFKMAELAFQSAVGYDIDISDDHQMIRAFHRWNENVKRTVPADRLLVFNVNEGWKPLCTFLNLPVPYQPFPLVNDRYDIRKMFRGIARMNMIVKGAMVALTGLSLGLAVTTVHNLTE